MSTRRHLALVSLAVLLGGLGAASAVGSTPRAQQYDQPGADLVEQAPTPVAGDLPAGDAQGDLPAGDAQAEVAVREALPFTGFEAGIVLAVGAGLLAAGTALRVVARRRSG